MTKRKSKFPPARALSWLSCGWRLVHRRADMFVGMAVLYLLLAFLLTRIPFAGPLLLVLITPALAAGAWLTARDVAHVAKESRSGHTDGNEAVPGRRAVIDHYVLQPMYALLQALGNEHQRLATLILCVVCLGIVMAIKVTEYVLIGGSMLSALQSPDVMSWLRPGNMVGMVVVGLLAVLAAMALLYVVPAAVFGNIEPFTALGRSFAISARNFFAVLIFFGVFLAGYLVVAAAFQLNAVLGFFVTFTLGAIVLTTYLGAMYCSYRDLFGTDESLTSEPA